jgi:hypothetical protein
MNSGNSGDISDISDISDSGDSDNIYESMQKVVDTLVVKRNAARKEFSEQYHHLFATHTLATFPREQSADTKTEPGFVLLTIWERFMLIPDSLSKESHPWEYWMNQKHCVPAVFTWSFRISVHPDEAKQAVATPSKAIL